MKKVLLSASTAAILASSIYGPTTSQIKKIECQLGFSKVDFSGLDFIGKIDDTGIDEKLRLETLNSGTIAFDPLHDTDTIAIIARDKQGKITMFHTIGSDDNTMLSDKKEVKFSLQDDGSYLVWAVASYAEATMKLYSDGSTLKLTDMDDTMIKMKEPTSGTFNIIVATEHFKPANIFIGALDSEKIAAIA